MSRSLAPAPLLRIAVLATCVAQATAGHAADAEGATPLGQRFAPTAPAKVEDSAARRAIAGDSPRAPLGSGVSDPELSALREAERALFPRTLVGFRSGWSWGKVNKAVQANGAPPMVDAVPSATHPAAAESEWLRSLTLPDLPVRLDERVVEYLRFYRDNPKGQDILKVWARKVGRYAPAMQAQLSRAGLPKDLVWLSVIESGHNPVIHSAAGAAGLWQFVPECARTYGLTVDSVLDERLDPERATEAAGKFLSDLYQRFGSWELALAAYNMGHAGLLTALRKYNTNDFWKLTEYEAGLPWETTLYVPKIFALAIVMNNRRAFGIGDITPDPAITFDRVYVSAGTSLENVAHAAGITFDALRSMNPLYLGGRLPAAGSERPRHWLLRVPRGSGRKVVTSLLDPAARRGYEPYAVRNGDTLETVARRRRISTEQLTTLNGFDSNEALIAGSLLVVPKLAEGQSPERDVEDAVVVPNETFQVPRRERAFYRVVAGDTLQSLAAVLGVSAEELAHWNQIDRGAKLQIGMTLQVYLEPGREPSNVRLVAERDTRVLTVGSAEFLEYFEALRGRKRITVRAKTGDTLAKIGARYGLSVGMMERINRCSRTKELTPGEAVIVYTEQPVAAGESSRDARLERSARADALSKRAQIE